MVGFWKVRTVEVAGVQFWQVYRETDAVRKADRIETYGGYWTTEREAEELAYRLNRREK